jgi:tetratricopeptide (TPR) repeat protein
MTRLVHPLALLLLTACPSTDAPQGERPTPEKVTPRTDPGPTKTPPVPKAEAAAKKVDEAAPPTFEAELARIDNAIAGAQKRADKQPNSYLLLDQVANRYLERARLSGDWADYQAADETLAKAFEVTKGFGPFLTRARLNYTLHRLDRVAPDIAETRVRKKHQFGGKQWAGVFVLEGNLAFQSGKYAEALTHYDKALALVEDFPGALTALATYKWKTGDFEGAEALFTKVQGQDRGKAAEPKAWFHLMLGLMDLDRGRYDEALAHYRTAETQLSGYWLVDEHVAEILTLTGKTEEAKKLYLDVIERTGNPEFLDAMAGILRAEGKEDEAKEYIAKAQAKYEAQLKQYPEAAYGHALGHYLEFGEDVKFTVDLAEKNHKVRPNGEAKTLLAQAYLLAKEPKKAKKVIEEALKTPFSTADLHATAVEVYETLGEADKAKAQREAALAINPKAFDE